MKKEKYKVLVETYFDKDTRKTYPKGDIIDLTKDKAERLLKIKCVEKYNKKEKPNKEVEEANEN